MVAGNSPFTTPIITTTGEEEFRKLKSYKMMAIRMLVHSPCAARQVIPLLFLPPQHDLLNSLLCLFQAMLRLHYDRHSLPLNLHNLAEKHSLIRITAHQKTSHPERLCFECDPHVAFCPPIMIHLELTNF